MPYLLPILLQADNPIELSQVALTIAFWILLPLFGIIFLLVIRKSSSLKDNLLPNSQSRNSSESALINKSRNEEYNNILIQLTSMKNQLSALEGFIIENIRNLQVLYEKQGMKFPNQEETEEKIQKSYEYRKKIQVWNNIALWLADRIDYLSEGVILEIDSNPLDGKCVGIKDLSEPDKKLLRESFSKLLSVIISAIIDVNDITFEPDDGNESPFSTKVKQVYINPHLKKFVPTLFQVFSSILTENLERFKTDQVHFGVEEKNTLVDILDYCAENIESQIF